jgi:hypothetical protein
MRLILYIHTVISEDVETQKHGVVFLFFPGEETAEHMIGEYFEDLKKIVKSLPFRGAAYHQQSIDGALFQLMSAVWFFFLASKDERVRTKFHRELSRLETQYELLTYGIPVHQIPTTYIGKIKVKNHLQWIKTRKAIDELRASSADVTNLDCRIICHPGLHDVLFSRGGNAGYPGNVEFRQNVSERLDKFLSTNGEARRKIRDEIVACVEARNGRFLQLHEGGWWEELPPDKVHKKMTSYFYFYIKSLDVKQPQQSTESDPGFFLRNNKRQKVGNECMNCR